MAAPFMEFLIPETRPDKQEGHGYLVSSDMTLREPCGAGLMEISRTSSAAEQQACQCWATVCEGLAEDSASLL